MRRNLFFTGLSGTGKSTVIHRALLTTRILPVGYRTIRIYDDHGNVCAYVVSDVRSPEVGVQFISRKREEEWHRDYSLFCRTALAALEGAETYDVVLMDEIGGKELLDAAFYERITELLRKPVLCIGALKDRSGMERLIKKPTTNNSIYRKTYERFRSFIEECPESEIFTVTENNREEMFKRAVSFLADA